MSINNMVSGGNYLYGTLIFKQLLIVTLCGSFYTGGEAWGNQTLHTDTAPPKELKHFIYVCEITAVNWQYCSTCWGLKKKATKKIKEKKTKSWKIRKKTNRQNEIKKWKADMIVRMSVVLNRTVVDSNWRWATCAVVIFPGKVSCIT